ncbi:NAD(P)-dependent oxidoreductase [Geodermatophilus sp. URMC 65]
MTTVALVGLGVMGSRMAQHITRVADVSAFDSNPDAVRAVAADGIRPLDDIGQVAGADVVILMLPDSDVVESVLGDPRDPASLAAALKPSTLVIDMGSSVPSRTTALADRLARAGVDMVDAPVSGGPRKAAAGELTIMVGGRPADVERARPLLETVGSTVTHTGAVGSAHALKALNNLLSAIGLVGALEVLTVGAKFGLDPRVMLDVINRSTGRNQSTEVKIESAVLDGRYDVGFALPLAVKDIGTAVDLASALELSTPVSQATVEVCRAALAYLDGPKPDQSEIARYVAATSGVNLSGRTEGT